MAADHRSDVLHSLLYCCMFRRTCSCVNAHALCRKSSVCQQSSLRKLARRAGFGEVFAADDSAAAEAAVRARVEAMAEKLATRVHQEIGSLPFTSYALPLSCTRSRDAVVRLWGGTVWHDAGSSWHVVDLNWVCTPFDRLSCHVAFTAT